MGKIMEQEHSYLNYQITGKHIPSICHERIRGIYKSIDYFVDYINLHNNGFNATKSLRFANVSTRSICSFKMEINFVLESHEDSIDAKIEDFVSRVCNLVMGEYKNTHMNMYIPDHPAPVIKSCKEFICGKISSYKNHFDEKGNVK